MLHILRDRIAFLQVGMFNNMTASNYLDLKIPIISYRRRIDPIVLCHPRSAKHRQLVEVPRRIGYGK
jgi:hypothetical protein